MPGELMTLGDYVAVIRRRRWVIAVLVLVLAVAGYRYALAKGTSYQATVEVTATYIQPPNPSGSTSASSPSASSDARYLANLAAFARSSTVLAAAARLGAADVPGTTAASFGQMSSVTPSTIADILYFQVDARKPGDAAKLAQDYARAYIAARRQQVTAQYGGQIATLKHQIATITATISAPGISKVTLQALRPQLQLALKHQAALTSYVAQENTSTALQPTTTAPSAVRTSPAKYGLGGALAGIVLGLIVAFVWDALDSRVRTSAQVTTSLNLPVLGSLPRPPRRLRRANQLVMTSGDGGGEAFRMLAARLELLCVERKVKTILVTSALDGEGKSTSAANLAVALAQMGRSVTLVDGDLVRPTAARFFGLEDHAGFTQVLAGETTLADALTRIDLPSVSTGGSLSVLPPGEPVADPAPLLATRKLGSTLRALARRSKYVIVDSPPLLSISHGMVISPHVDAVLVIARADELRSEVAGQLTEALAALPAEKLGVVLTGADNERGYGYGYGYYAPGSRAAGRLRAGPIDAAVSRRIASLTDQPQTP
jgi:capsular exopolysaccharide synthesis family protein